MFTTTTSIAIWRRARPFDIEAVGRARLEAEKPAHHRLPLPAVRPSPPAIFQMMDQPVGHLVGYHLDQEVDPVLGIQHRVEAQPAAAKMCLPRTPPPQIEPYARPGQPGVNLPAQCEGVGNPLMQGVREAGARESGKRFGVGMGQGGSHHEC